MSYPLIGNYGVNPEDIEYGRILVAAFLIEEYQAYPSNFRAPVTVFMSVIDNDKKTVLPVAAKYRKALRHKIPDATNTAGGMAIFRAIETWREKRMTDKTLQEHNSES